MSDKLDTDKNNVNSIDTQATGTENVLVMTNYFRIYWKHQLFLAVKLFSVTVRF